MLMKPQFSGGALDRFKAIVFTIANGDSDSIRKVLYHPCFAYQFFFRGGSRAELGALLSVPQDAIHPIPMAFIQALRDGDVNIYHRLSPGNFVGVYWHETEEATGLTWGMETVGLVAAKDDWREGDKTSVLIMRDAEHGANPTPPALELLTVPNSQTFIHPFGPTVVQYNAFLSAISVDVASNSLLNIVPDASRYDHTDRFMHGSLVKIVAGAYRGCVATFDGHITAACARHKIVVNIQTHDDTPDLSIVIPASYATAEFSKFDRVIYQSQDVRSRAYIRSHPSNDGSPVDVVLEESGKVLSVDRSALTFVPTAAHYTLA